MELLNNINFWMIYSMVLSAGILYTTYLLILKEKDDEDHANQVMADFLDFEGLSKEDCLNQIRHANAAIDVLKSNRQKASEQLLYLREIETYNKNGKPEYKKQQNLKNPCI